MFSAAQGVDAFIRHIDYVQSNSQIFFENLVGKVLYCVVWRYKNEQDRKHSRMEEIRK